MKVRIWILDTCFACRFKYDRYWNFSLAFPFKRLLYKINRPFWPYGLLVGIIALTGALSYSDVSRLIPKSGGEYAFLDKLLHPSFGFSAGFISVFAGFAGPLAIASITLGEYALESQCVFWNAI